MHYFCSNIVTINIDSRQISILKSFIFKLYYFRHIALKKLQELIRKVATSLWASVQVFT